VYTEFFGLNEKPFSITPDPRYLYLSRRHADALAHLIYGISESGGFIQLTGEVGTGKTTLIRTLLQQLPEKAEIALILNPQLSAREFLRSICDELGAPRPEDESVRAVIASLNSYLLKAYSEGRRIVLIVDEAQTLGPELLEQVRLLTNLETATQKLLQIILIGQPELRDVLQRPEMRQIAQRVTGRYHLEPLGKSETEAYVKHRLRVAGCQMPIFTRPAMAELYRKSAGIPRLINVVADRALLAAYSKDRARVDRALVKQAAAEVLGKPPAHAWPWGIAAALVAAISLAGGGAWVRFHDRGDGPAAPATAGLAERAAAGLPERTRVEPFVSPPRRESREPDATEPRSLRDILSELGPTASSDTALTQLFALWDGRYDPRRGDACLQASEQDLRCLSGQHGSIGELRTIDRPAILSVRDASGKEHEVVLAALGYDDAELVVGDERLRIRVSELTHDWYGRHLILWRPPFDGPKALKPGSRAPEVVWLRQSLARIRGQTLDGELSTLYDPTLEAAVREYQRERMLAVDGIVGTRTQIAMTTDLGVPATPTLRED
jgi:general secretion pathway protein A